MKDTFLLRPRLRIVGGVLNLFCITGEVIGIKDLKMEEKLKQKTFASCGHALISPY